MASIALGRILRRRQQLPVFGLVLPSRAAHATTRNGDNVVNRHPQTPRLAGQRDELTPDLSRIGPCGTTSAGATDSASSMCSRQVLVPVGSPPAFYFPALHLAGRLFAYALSLARRTVGVSPFAV